MNTGTIYFTQEFFPVLSNTLIIPLNINLFMNIIKTVKIDDGIAFMRVYIGTFDEEDVEDVLKDMRGAKIKTELRPFLDVHLEGRYFMEGRLSELKEKYGDSELKEVVAKWEEYIKKAKEVMKDGIEEKEFEENFLDMVFSEEERRVKKKIDNILKEGEDVETRMKLLNDAIKEMGKEKMDEFVNQFMRELQLMNGVHEILSLNGIKYENEKMYGEIPEDPMLRINVEIGEKMAEKLNLEFTFDVYVDKGVSIYGNLMDIIYENKRLKELADEMPEYIELVILSDIMGMMMEKIEGKMDVERFIEEVREMEEDGHHIRLTHAAIEEIIKTLEKMEFIKIKKGKIWLKKE